MTANEIRLMECPIDVLRLMIKHEEQSLDIVKSTLKTMIEVLDERMATPPPVQSDQSDDAPQPCENCNGRGVISFNPNLNPNAFPGVEVRRCTRCNGTGESPDTDRHEKDAIRCGERPFERNAVLPDDDEVL
jgi:hypothetical protein